MKNKLILSLALAALAPTLKERIAAGIIAFCLLSILAWSWRQLDHKLT